MSTALPASPSGEVLLSARRSLRKESTCSVVAYSSPSPSRTVVQVACFDAAEKLMADTPFTIMVVGNQSLPVPSAFVMSGGPAPVPAPPDPASRWTNAPHPTTVTHETLGESGGLRVRCYDRSGAATDQGFSVVQVAGGRPGRRIGFAIAHDSGVASYTPYSNWSFNSAGGTITATHASRGHYAMHFAGLQTLPGHTEHMQVTASTATFPSPTLATCNVVSRENVADSLTVFVKCRDGAGQFIDAVYYVLVIE